MAERKRVYHPETDEPFDLPVAKANELVLEKGWRQQPLNPKAEPLVQTVTVDRGSDTSSECTLEEDWRDTEVGQEVVEATPVRRSRKPK